MKKFRFDLNYIKKNLNINNFIKDISKLDYDKYGGGDMFFKDIRHSFNGNDETYGILLDDYWEKKQ